MGSNIRRHLLWNMAIGRPCPFHIATWYVSYRTWSDRSLHHLETGGRSKAFRGPSGQLLLAEVSLKSKYTTLSPELPMKSPAAVMRFTSPRMASSMR